jgi:putative sterol carrier protein
VTVQQYIDRLVQKVETDPAGLKGVHGVYQFNIIGENGGTYQVKVQDQELEYTEGTPYTAHSTFSLSANHFEKLFKGELNPVMAVMSGKVKIKGDLSRAKKLQNVVHYYK